MKQLYLVTGCHPYMGYKEYSMNQTKSGSLLAAIIRGCDVINDTSLPVYVDIIEPEKTTDETDSGAVLYIVAVLVFYSAGIITMIVKYLKREKRELEEERALEDFFRSMPAYKKEREQNKVNRIAIHAFHALTSLSYDDDDLVSSDESVQPCEDTIHEVDDDDHEKEENDPDETNSKMTFVLGDNVKNKPENLNENEAETYFL